MSRRKNTDGVHYNVYSKFKPNSGLNRQRDYYNFYYNQLEELAINRFKWTGLPDTIDRRFLEVTLFRHGLSVFYFDTDFDRFLALRGAGVGQINMYDNPTQFAVHGGTGIVNKQLNPDECVPIYSSYNRKVEMQTIELFASELAEISTTISINIKGMRNTHIITVPENKRLSYVNLMKQIREGDPIIWGTDSLSPDEYMNVFNLGIDKEYVLNLQVAKQKIWNECMQHLGINNANQEKKERLISGEVDANDEQVEQSKTAALNARKYAVEQINKRYGLNVCVEWNNNVVNAVPGESNEVDVV